MSSKEHPTTKHQYIVTVRLPKDPNHDPKNKVTGRCRVLWGQTCTDVTGEHHSTLVIAPNIDQVKEAFADYHITRIEDAGEVVSL